MRMDQASDLLVQNPAPFEDGWCVLPDGIGLVAARTEMPGCSGAMVRWWFDTLRDSARYRLWYPDEHVYLRSTRAKDVASVIGDTHVVHEKLGGDTVHKLKLRFRDPAEVLDPGAMAAAGVTCAILIRGGPQHLPLWSGNVLHLISDQPGGAVMRSRFWMGDVSPAVPILARLIRREMTSDTALGDLHRHCKAEMANLARILPGLYAAG